MPSNRFKAHSVASDDTEALRPPFQLGMQFEVSRPGTAALVRLARRIPFCFLRYAAENVLGILSLIKCVASCSA